MVRGYKTNRQRVTHSFVVTPKVRSEEEEERREKREERRREERSKSCLGKV